jgi:two-component system sensor histidine kinase DegS
MRIELNRHFWAIVVLFAIFTFIHYVEQLGILGTAAPSSHFGLTRHALERILYLIPIVYACYKFGLKAGLAVCVAAGIAMLPRAVLISPAREDAIFEVVAILAVGAAACFLLSALARERQKVSAALEELEKAHGLLQHYVRSARSTERRLTMLNAVSTILAESLELKNVLVRAIHAVMELMEVEVALIYSLNDETRELELVAYEGVSEEFASAVDKIKVGEGFNGEVARTGRSLVVEDASRDPRLTRPEVKRMRIHSQLIVPLILRDEIKGTLCVANRRPRTFFPEEQELLSSVGNQIAVAIENGRLYEEARTSAQRLAASEKNYRELFENANDAIWVHDLLGNIIVANKATERITGYSIEELAHMSVKDFLSEEGLDLAGKVRRSLLEKEPVEQPYEQHLVRKDGTQATLMLTTSLMTDNGRPTAFQHIARDVTEEIRMKENLRYHLQQTTRAQEEERKRIARELHDDTAQTLFALNRRLDNYMRSSGSLTADDRAFLEGLGQQIKGVLEGVRRFSQALRPPMLDDLGLLAALRWLVGDLEKQSGMKAELRVSGAEERLSPEAELLVFRIVQEAMRNVERHARASKVVVDVEFGGGKIKAAVADDGRGFDSSVGLSDLPRKGKLGLAGIQERVRLLGGSLRVQSEPGKGTSVSVEVPSQTASRE